MHHVCNTVCLHCRLTALTCHWVESGAAQEAMSSEEGENRRLHRVSSPTTQRVITLEPTVKLLLGLPRVPRTVPLSALSRGIIPPFTVQPPHPTTIFILLVIRMRRMRERVSEGGERVSEGGSREERERGMSPAPPPEDEREREWKGTSFPTSEEKEDKCERERD